MAGASQKDEEPITAINVTPLVDVCLVLVIIFMAVAPMAVTLGIKVLETRSSNAEGKASVDENVNIRITEDGGISVNGTKTDGVTFRGILAAQLLKSKDKMVIITADAKNKVGLVVEVLDASKQAGALKLAIMKSEAAPGGPS
ncbi:MAG: biopolymer transporter ExbD [Elusimicrobia bacterium]|nr:biopolymer transporter ExbD [Elusimicrobiota bacterium]